MTNGAESAELWLGEAGEGLLCARPPSGRTQTRKIENCSHRFIYKKVVVSAGKFNS
jgi:hypothetical protein